MAETKTLQLVDVRTPEEFSGGYLKHAVNINVNDNSFQSRIEKLDKNTPVFVYCQSGVRSKGAAKTMRNMGFVQVYEMDGGMLKWRAAGLPEVGSAEASPESMSADAYKKLTSGKSVLIDFYAEWCVPCKKMKPYLEEIAKEQSGKLEIVRIDTDKNKELCKELGVSSVPLLLYYTNGQMNWKHDGYISKEDLLKKLP